MKWRSRTFFLFIVLAIVYAFITLSLSPSRASLTKYHLSTGTLHTLNAWIIIPVFITWFVSLYGYQLLRKYSDQLGRKKEGKAVLDLTRGVMFIVLRLPIVSTASIVLGYIERSHTKLIPVTTVLINYISLIFILIAMGYISKGGWRLAKASKHRLPQFGVHIMALGLIAIGVAYGYLVATNRASIGSIYHLPISLVFITIVVPYIFSWYLGLLAAFYIHQYSKEVPGVIYRKSWNTLAYGLVWLILFSVVYQYFTTVSNRLGMIPLAVSLSVIYGVLLLMAIGFIFVAIGAKRLTKIEEV